MLMLLISARDRCFSPKSGNLFVCMTVDSIDFFPLWSTLSRLDVLSTNWSHTDHMCTFCRSPRTWFKLFLFLHMNWRFAIFDTNPESPESHMINTFLKNWYSAGIRVSKSSVLFLFDKFIEFAQINQICQEREKEKKLSSGSSSSFFVIITFHIDICHVALSVGLASGRRSHKLNKWPIYVCSVAHWIMPQLPHCRSAADPSHIEEFESSSQFEIDLTHVH